MKIGNGEFWLGECIERMRDIPDGSVDMILCDLPYGMTACKWDSVIPFEPLWEHYWRVAKPNAAVVLTAAQPFTSALVMSQVDRFRYVWTWKKSRPTNFANAKKQPLRNIEDVCVFYRSQPTYNPQGLIVVSRNRKNSKSQGGQIIQGETLDTERGNMRTPGASYTQEHSNYPTQFVEFARESSVQHPTQKPVALFEYLIKTYTDPDMLVLDNCAGSGTTAIAAERTSRRWLCIEREPNYYYPAVGRVWSEVHGS